MGCASSTSIAVSDIEVVAVDNLVERIKQRDSQVLTEALYDRGLGSIKHIDEYIESRNKILGDLSLSCQDLVVLRETLVREYLERVKQRFIRTSKTIDTIAGIVAMFRKYDNRYIKTPDFDSIIYNVTTLYVVTCLEDAVVSSHPEDYITITNQIHTLLIPYIREFEESDERTRVLIELFNSIRSFVEIIVQNDYPVHLVHSELSEQFAAYRLKHCAIVMIRNFLYKYDEIDELVCDQDMDPNVFNIVCIPLVKIRALYEFDEDMLQSVYETIVCGSPDSVDEITAIAAIVMKKRRIVKKFISPNVGLIDVPVDKTHWKDVFLSNELRNIYRACI